MTHVPGFIKSINKLKYHTIIQLAKQDDLDPETEPIIDDLIIINANELITFESQPCKTIRNMVGSNLAYTWKQRAF